MIIQHMDTSKCQYINGVVIKKGIAHKQMEIEISNPRILVLGKTLGHAKDDSDFFYIENESSQEIEYLKNIVKKI